MKIFFLWFTAFLITIGAAVYQRHTGPTYPKELAVTANGKSWELSLVRSLSLDEPAEVFLGINDSSVKPVLFYKRFGTDEAYAQVNFSFSKEKEQPGFYAPVPQQPAAGKIQYYIKITDSSGTITLLREEPVVIRFKGAVPAFILVPHILLMFLAMFFSNLAGIMSIIKYPAYKKYSGWTLILLLAGGMMLGPLVQYYAFGELWTGIPFGWDLTDNKTLIAVIFWIIAVYMNRKTDKPVFTAIASLALLLVYSIPHSMFGSELDYSTGEITQG
ncbi:MAG TPA: hypothetical protein VK213_01585 [Bacteroidales bacterium]|nr:hypothetical protein [Bacteroidales bacterium]